MRCLALTLLLALARTVVCAESLQGKVAVITGASSGIGMVTAKELAKKGMSVVLLARRTDKLAEVVDEIKKAGGEAAAKACDVENPVSIEWAFEFAQQKYGGVDFVFVNAGVEGGLGHAALVDQSDASLHTLFNINVIGAVETLKYAVKAFELRGGGTIVFSSSIIAFCGDVCRMAVTSMYKSLNMEPPLGHGIAYAATKAALDMVAEGAHGNYHDKGVKVYNLNIGQFASEMGDRLGFQDGSAGMNPVKVGKLGDSIHIAECIIAILDGTSKWPPGTAMLIDNDVTVHAKYFYDKRKDPGPIESFGWRSPEELKKVAMNVKGEPYVWKDEL